MPPLPSSQPTGKASWFLKLTKLGLVLTLLTPLVASDRFMFPLVFPRTIYFRLVVAATAVAYLGLLRVRPEYTPNLRSPLNRAVLLFAAVQVVAALFGVNPYVSFASTIARSEGVLTLLHLVVFFLIATAVWRDGRSWRMALELAVSVVFLHGLLGLGQAFGFPGVPTFGSYRPTGLMGNPAFFGTLLLFGVGLPLVLESRYLRGQAAAPPPVAVRAWHALVIAVSFANLWLTQIRGVNYTLILGTLAVLGWYARRAVVPAKRRAAAVALAVLAGLILTLILGRGTALVTWNSTLQRLTQLDWSTVTLQNRLISWSIGLQGFRERPVLGWGPENFSVVFDRHFNPAISRDWGSFSWYDRAHNIVVETLVGSGLAGLTAYLAIFAMAAWAIRALARQGEQRTAAVFLTALLGAYFLQNLSSFDTLSSLLLIYLVLGSLAFATTAQPTPPLARPLSRGAAASAAAAVGVLAVILNITPALATFAASQVHLDPQRPLEAVRRDFLRALRLSPPQRHEFRQALGNVVLDQFRKTTLPPAETFDPLLSLALDQLQRSAAVDPANLQTHLILSEIARLRSAGTPALQELARREAAMVVAVAPRRYHGYFALGRAEMSAGNHRAGIAAFREAAVRYPNLASAWWNLAVAYALDGQVSAAQPAIARARQLDASLSWQPENVGKLARAFADGGAPAAAITLYREATEREPHNAEYFRQLSQLLRDAGQAAESKAAARRAIELNPVLGAELEPSADAP